MRAPGWLEAIRLCVHGGRVGLGAVGYRCCTGEVMDGIQKTAMSIEAWGAGAFDKWDRGDIILLSLAINALNSLSETRPDMKPCIAIVLEVAKGS